MTDKSDAEKIADYLAKEAAFIRDLFEIAKGGKGSGNFGHRGRPGERGGSSTEGGGGTPKPATPAPKAPEQPSATATSPAKAPATPVQAIANMYRERYSPDGTKWPDNVKESFLKVQMTYHEDRGSFEFKNGAVGKVTSGSLGQLNVTYTTPDGREVTNSFEKTPAQGGKQANMDDAAHWLREVHEGKVPVEAPVAAPLPKGAADPKNVPSEYKNADNLVDAERYAKDTLGVNVRLVKDSPGALSVLNKMNESFTVLHNAGYYIPKNVEPEGMGGKELAGWQLTGRGDAFEAGSIEGVVVYNKNSSAFNTPDGMQKIIDDNYAHDFFSTKNPLHLFVHETGHMNHYVQNPGQYAGTALFKYGEDRRRKVSAGFLAVKARHPVSWTPQEINTATKVSNYAKSAPGEFIAEAFTGIVLGKTYDKDVMELYDKLGGPKPVRKK